MSRFTELAIKRFDPREVRSRANKHFEDPRRLTRWNEKRNPTVKMQILDAYFYGAVEQRTIDEKDYDRMKLALEKALEQRDDYASYVDNVKYRLPGLKDCDDKIQRILEGKE